MNRPLLLAADIGGTTARAVAAPAATESARLPDPSTGPGCNIRSAGTGGLAQIVPTLLAALGGASGDDVERAVLSLSGAGPARRAEIEDAIADLLAPAGIDRSRITVVDDLHAAFAAGGAGPDGILVLAGTGAVAARFAEGRLIARTDGMGWVLGDVGSAVWLGHQVLRAVAADIDERGRRTLLTERLGDVLELELRDGIDCPTGDPRQDLIRAIDPLAPADWGRFAQLPGECLPDPVARDILDRAARALADSVRRMDPDAVLPVVLAGSVLTSDGPLRDELRSGIELAGHPVVVEASQPIVGAWRIAQAAAAQDLADPRAQV